MVNTGELTSAVLCDGPLHVDLLRSPVCSIPRALAGVSLTPNREEHNE